MIPLRIALLSLRQVAGFACSSPVFRTVHVRPTLRYNQQLAPRAEDISFSVALLVRRPVPGFFNAGCEFSDRRAAQTAKEKKRYGYSFEGCSTGTQG